MTTHRWTAAALCASVLLLARHAAADDEIVVRAKRSDALQVDRGALHIDLAPVRQALAASLENALAAAGNPAPAPVDRVASATPAAQDSLLK
jgi:hypothetical protein